MSLTAILVIMAGNRNTSIHSRNNRCIGGMLDRRYSRLVPHSRDNVDLRPHRALLRPHPFHQPEEFHHRRIDRLQSPFADDTSQLNAVSAFTLESDITDTLIHRFSFNYTELDPSAANKVA
jgi:hypothetical protein